MLWMQVRSTMLCPNICYYALGLEWQRFREFGEATQEHVTQKIEREGVPGGRAGPTALPSDPGKPGRRASQKDSPGEGKEEREDEAGAADSVSLSPDRDASKKAR